VLDFLDIWVDAGWKFGGLGRTGKSKVIVTGCNRPVKCKAVVKAKGAAANCQDFPILLRAGGA
jgi:hypothetical protein